MCIKTPTPLQTRKVIRVLQRWFQILLWTQTEVKVKVAQLEIHASNYKRIPEPQNLLRVLKICTLMLRKTTRLINALCPFNLQLRWNKRDGWKSAPTRAYQASTKWHARGKLCHQVSAAKHRQYLFRMVWPERFFSCVVFSVIRDHFHTWSTST